MQNRMFFAEASSIMSSDLYMTVQMVMFVAEEANLNGVRVTEAFIDDVVANQDRYITLPLVADTRMLWNGGHLGHKYDPKSDTFDTTIIGSFYKFEKKVEAQVASLIGYARISKRDQETCNAIAKLYAEGGLKFSFEIACSVMSELEDGTMLIDARPGNYLTSLCVVSQPACSNAVAMQLVAESTNEEAEAMNENEQTVQVVEVAEEVTSPAQEVVASTTESSVGETETAACKPKAEDMPEKKEEKECPECSEIEEAACGKKPMCEVEEAACGKKPCGENEEASCGKKLCETEEASCGKKLCETEEAACGKKPCGEEETAACGKKPCGETEEAACGKKKCAEEMIAELSSVIASLQEEIASIKTAMAEQQTVIAEMQQPKTVVAESTRINGEDLMEDTKTWGLLETDSRIGGFTLI